MIYDFSEEFEAAIKAEVLRIKCEWISEFRDSDEYLEILEKDIQKAINDAFYCFHVSSGKAELYYSPGDNEASVYIDLERAVEDEIAEVDEDQNDKLSVLLERLEAMATRIREHLAHNGEVSGGGDFPPSA